VRRREYRKAHKPTRDSRDLSSAAGMSVDRTESFRLSTFLITGRFASTSSSDCPLGRRPFRNSRRLSLASGWSSSLIATLIPYSALRSRMKIVMIQGIGFVAGHLHKPAALTFLSSIRMCRKNSISNRPLERALATRADHNATFVRLQALRTGHGRAPGADLEGRAAGSE